ncbi:MAG: hypothetical protein JXR76_12055 [Deltaproteobacteria bacterium]|nr:hypothetical protein [Deltaproteobacteria bacterium]
MSIEPTKLELQAARLGEIELTKNRETLRLALETATETCTRRQKRKRVVRAIFSMGVTLGFVLGIACVWMLQSHPRPAVVQVATNLGRVWCTYSDASTGGNSVVWPPESTEGQNNFVKSAPGYGDKGYAIRFKGTAGERSKEGFIGVSTLLGPPCPSSGCTGVNIQKFSKIRFKMKGAVSDGELVLLISDATVSDSETSTAATLPQSVDAYEAQITDFVTDDWQTVTLDLRNDFQFAKSNNTNKHRKVEAVLAAAKNIKWHVRNAKGADVDVWIDELEFF